MKKTLSLVFAFALVLAVMLGLASCGKEIEFNVNFVVDGEVYAAVGTSGNETIKIPENPTKEGYNFDGWYWDNGTWQKPFTANSLLDAPLSSNMSVYAKWIEIHIHSFTIENVASEYLASVADCENAATYYYSCSCGAKGAETFTNGSALEHVDTDKDHACDYGCSSTIGNCVDIDKDHYCDYGCDKIFGEHTDGDDNNIT